MSERSLNKRRWDIIKSWQQKAYQLCIIYTNRWGFLILRHLLEEINVCSGQLLLFIRRRKKDDVLAELPPKSVIDIMSPLSVVQAGMYSRFLETLRTSDDELEAYVSRMANNADASSIAAKSEGAAALFT